MPFTIQTENMRVSLSFGEISLAFSFTFCWVGTLFEEYEAVFLLDRYRHRAGYCP